MLSGARPEHAGEGREVGEHFDNGEATGGQDSLGGSGLPRSDLDEEAAVRSEDARGHGGEAAERVEAVRAPGEGQARFVAGDFGLERLDLVIRDVGEVGRHQIERAGGDRLEQVALNGLRAAGEAGGFGVPLGESERGWRNVEQQYRDGRQLRREGEADAAGAAAHVGNPEPSSGGSGRLSERGLDEGLRIGARDQRLGADGEPEAEELHGAHEMLERPPRRALLDELMEPGGAVIEARGGGQGQGSAPVGRELRRGPAEGVSEQPAGVEGGGGDTGSAEAALRSGEGEPDRIRSRAVGALSAQEFSAARRSACSLA